MVCCGLETYLCPRTVLCKEVAQHRCSPVRTRFGRATVLVVKRWGIILLPWRAMRAHRVEHREQLTQTRGQRDRGGLPCTTQTLVEGVEEWMVPHGHAGAHREHRAPVGPAAPHGPVAPQGATVPVEGGDADQGRDRLPAPGPPRREVDNQR